MENRRLILTVREIRERYPVYEVGDKITFEFPEMSLNYKAEYISHSKRN